MGRNDTASGCGGRNRTNGEATTEVQRVAAAVQRALLHTRAPRPDRHAVEMRTVTRCHVACCTAACCNGAACNVPQTTRGPHHCNVAWHGIAATACSFSGLRMPFERLVALLEERGVHALVDAAQCVRHANRALLHAYPHWTTRARTRARRGAAAALVLCSGVGLVDLHLDRLGASYVRLPCPPARPRAADRQAAAARPKRTCKSPRDPPPRRRPSEQTNTEADGPPRLGRGPLFCA